MAKATAKSKAISSRQARTKAPKESTVVDQPDGWSENEQRQALHAHLVKAMHEFLDLSNVPERGRVPIVARITHRARQGVARWFHESTDSAALPDVLSIFLFAQAFQADTNYLLGLTNRRRTIHPLNGTHPSNHREPTSTHGVADQVMQIAREIGELFPATDCITMVGDEMEPLIRRETKVWLDRTIAEIQGNGIYALQFDGRTIVRIVEDRPGEGIILICDNKRYRDQVIPTHAELAANRIKVLGKIVGWFRVP